MKRLIVTAAALMTICSIWAQAPLSESYNAAVTAFNAKNYAEAAKNFELVIEQGFDSEDPEAMTWVQTAKSSLPKCYFQLGGAQVKSGQWETAIEDFTKSADFAALYGDTSMEARARGWVATCYMKMGEASFNSKDYAAASEIFAKGYAANPKNTEMANYLGICYCETDRFAEGMAIFQSVAALKNPKFAEDAAKAADYIKLYTNNRLASLQAASDYDGIIAMADELLVANPIDAMALKIRLQACFDKKDYAAVVASAEEAAAAQTTDEDRSDVYFILGAAYNAQSMPAQAIEALQKVTAGSNVAAAQQTAAKLAEAAKK